MATRKERRKKYSGRAIRIAIEQSITRTRMYEFTVYEVQVGCQAYKLMCKEYGDDLLEEILGVPIVVEDTDTPYEFGMTTDVPRYMDDPIAVMKEQVGS